MARRDKHDMEQMRDTVNYYLLINSNNPHSAYKKLDVKQYQNTRMAIVGLWYAIVEKSIQYINNSELGYIQEFLRNNNILEVNTN